MAKERKPGITRPSRHTTGEGKRALPRVLCIVGPTSSGKTDLGIALAKKFHGEIINADARQVYKWFSLGTGKPLDGKWCVRDGKRVFMVRGVPHHLMDVLMPKKVFTVAEWRKRAMKTAREIIERGHVPIVVGGTGLYVQSLVDNYHIPSVPPQMAYREAMEAKTLEELLALLHQVDPTASQVVDVKNRRRVLRALEVVTYTGKSFSSQRSKEKPEADFLMIGVNRPREELYARINQQVDRMVENGWAKEIRSLHERGIGWDAPAMTAIGYRELAAFVRGECTLEEAVEKTKIATRHYAKRQMTWFKRDTRIHWVEKTEDAVALVKEWVE